MNPLQNQKESGDSSGTDQPSALDFVSEV